MNRFPYILTCILLYAGPILADEAIMDKGQAVFEKWCLPCHGEGANFPGTAALQAKYQGKVQAVLTKRTGLTADFIKHFVRNGVSIMPFFRKTEISDEELDALAAYLIQK